MYEGSGSIPSPEQKTIVEMEAGSKGTEKMLLCTLTLCQRIQQEKTHKEMKKKPIKGWGEKNKKIKSSVITSIKQGLSLYDKRICMCAD